MKSFKLYTVVILLISFTSISATFAPEGEEYVIIVNTQVPMDAITQKQLSDYFLGNMTMFKNKAKAKPCYRTNLDNFFLEKLEMSASKFKEHWTRKVFSGYGVAPVKYTDDQRVIEYVARQKGGIGVISKSASANLNDKCKVITVN